MSRRPPDQDRSSSTRSASPPPPPAQSAPAREQRRPSSSLTDIPLVSSSSSASRQASLGVSTGRAPRGTSARRSSRRASLDPYSTAGVASTSRQASPETALRPPPGESGSRRVSRSRTPVREAVEEEETEAAGRGEQAEEGREEAMSFPPRGERSDMNFRLVMLQQPKVGAEAGLSKNTLGRLPIVPAPVVELVVQDQHGERVDREFPFLFCSCSLRQADGVSSVEVAQPAASTSSTADDTSANEEFSALVGGLVKQAHRISDLDGTQRDVFVFEDVSVRTKGSYKLEFTLSEAIRPKSPKLAATRSDQFEVVEWQEYPKPLSAAETVPDLSLHLHKQSVPMYIPPLLLSAPADNPPPAGSNPFPALQVSAATSAAMDELVEAAAAVVAGDAARRGEEDSP